MTDIKKKFFSGVIWKFAERFLAQIVSLFVAIILARILTPDDYSVVGIVLIFFAFANVFISGGLNTALIQKKNADVIDFSTIFISSEIVALLIYFVLFFSAPFWSDVFHKEELTLIIRVMGLILPVMALKSVLCAYISANLLFRKFFFSTIGGTVFSAIIGLWLAQKGFGAWALVVQQMSNSIIDTLILFIISHLKLRLIFSFEIFHALFNYGYKIFISSLLNTAYGELVPFVTGMKFSPADLAFYVKGRSFPTLFATTMNSTLSAVLFPVLSKFQDDREKILKYTRLYIQVTSFVVFPAMLGLFICSDRFVLILLTEKWLPASIFIKIFCVSSMFSMIAIGNCETIKAIGRSDVFLIMEIIKKSTYFVIIVLFVFFCKSPVVLAVSAIICTTVALIVNSYPNKKLIGYNYILQIMDILPSLLSAVIMCIPMYYVGKMRFSDISVFCLQVVFGIVFYLSICLLLKNKGLFYLVSLVHKKKEKND